MTSLREKECSMTKKVCHYRASQSFRKSEVEVVHKLLTVLRSGGDVRLLLRNKDLAMVAKKFQAMHAKCVDDDLRILREQSEGEGGS